MQAQPNLNVPEKRRFRDAEPEHLSASHASTAFLCIGASSPVVTDDRLGLARLASAICSKTARYDLASSLFAAC